MKENYITWFCFLVNALCQVEEGLGSFQYIHSDRRTKTHFYFTKKQIRISPFDLTYTVVLWVALRGMDGCGEGWVANREEWVAICIRKR